MRFSRESLRSPGRRDGMGGMNGGSPGSEESRRMSPRARPSAADLDQRVEELTRQLAEARDRESAADRQVAQLRRDRAEAVERETEGLAREIATSEILRVIASSPTDVQP